MAKYWAIMGVWAAAGAPVGRAVGEVGAVALKIVVPGGAERGEGVRAGGDYRRRWGLRHRPGCGDQRFPSASDALQDANIFLVFYKNRQNTDCID
jgi:hypothetical protein